jgi:hypothetical protein
MAEPFNQWTQKLRRLINQGLQQVAGGQPGNETALRSPPQPHLPAVALDSGHQAQDICGGNPTIRDHHIISPQQHTPGAPGHYAGHHQFTRFRVAKGGHVAGPRRAAGVW